LLAVRRKAALIDYARNIKGSAGALHGLLKTSRFKSCEQLLKLIKYNVKELDKVNNCRSQRKGLRRERQLLLI